jgi:hypothetical protein
VPEESPDKQPMLPAPTSAKPTRAVAIRRLVAAIYGCQIRRTYARRARLPKSLPRWGASAMRLRAVPAVRRGAHPVGWAVLPTAPLHAAQPFCPVGAALDRRVPACIWCSSLKVAAANSENGPDVTPGPEPFRGLRFVRAHPFPRMVGVPSPTVCCNTDKPAALRLMRGKWCGRWVLRGGRWWWSFLPLRPVPKNHAFDMRQ